MVSDLDFKKSAPTFPGFDQCPGRKCDICDPFLGDLESVKNVDGLVVFVIESITRAVNEETRGSDQSKEKMKMRKIEERRTYLRKVRHPARFPATSNDESQRGVGAMPRCACCDHAMPTSEE